MIDGAPEIDTVLNNTAWLSTNLSGPDLSGPTKKR
jgi:hypothetical protein